MDQGTNRRHASKYFVNKQLIVCFVTKEQNFREIDHWNIDTFCLANPFMPNYMLSMPLAEKNSV